MTKKIEACKYPECNCPFDAPSDPSWCARGLPKPREEYRWWITNPPKQKPKGAVSDPKTVIVGGKDMDELKEMAGIVREERNILDAELEELKKIALAAVFISFIAFGLALFL